MDVTRAAALGLGVVAMILLAAPWAIHLMPSGGDYSDTVAVDYGDVVLEVPADDAEWFVHGGFPWGYYRLVMPEDPAVVALSESIRDACGTEWGYLLAEAARQWVHDSIRYVTDPEAHGRADWWQTPYETLRLGTGDCEDMSALLASVLVCLGFDTVLVREDGHLMVGVFVWDHGTDGIGTVGFRGETYLVSDPTSDLPTGTVDAEPVAVYPVTVSSTAGTVMLASLLVAILLGRLMLKVARGL